MRRQTPALRTGGSVQTLNAGYPLVYLRGGTALVVINLRREPVSFRLPFAGRAGRLDDVVAHRAAAVGGEVAADGFGYGIFML